MVEELMELALRVITTANDPASHAEVIEKLKKLPVTWAYDRLWKEDYDAGNTESSVWVGDLRGDDAEEQLPYGWCFPVMAQPGCDGIVILMTGPDEAQIVQSIDCDFISAPLGDKVEFPGDPLP